MVHHIVMWNFRTEVPEAERNERMREMAEHLESLVGKVPGLLSAKFVSEVLPSSTHDMALVTTLEKAEDIAVYANHPEHVKAADTYVRPFVCDRVCLDYDDSYSICR